MGASTVDAKKAEEGGRSSNDLLQAPPVVVNVGLERFYQDLKALGADAVHVRWTPPAGGDPRLGALLSRLGC